MCDRANYLFSYVVPPVNIQYSVKTVVLKSENLLFLLLVQFPIFTAIEEGKEYVIVEQHQSQFLGVLFQSSKLL